MARGMGPHLLLVLLLIVPDFGFSLMKCGEFEECVELSKCRDWYAKLKNKSMSALSMDLQLKFKRAICGFADHVRVKRCCKMDQIITNSPLTRPVSTRPDQTSLTRTVSTRPDSCGKILVEGVPNCGGCDDVSTPGAWPWMARLLYPINRPSQEPENTYCGGALVSRHHVVTAAHCLSEEPEEPLAVVLGELDVTTEYDCIIAEDGCGADGKAGRKCRDEERCAERAKMYRVKTVIVHQNYSKTGSRKSKNSVYDVAILVLDKPVTFSPYIQPVCLPSPERATSSFDYPRQLLVIKGWGNVVEGRGPAHSATVLQELRGLKEQQLDDTGDEVGCRTLLRGVAELESHHMCVWKEGVPANGCQGDSGGPLSRLYRKDRWDTGTWELAGIISFGVTRSCGSNTPLVVTRVGDPAILSWIKGYMREV